MHFWNYLFFDLWEVCIEKLAAVYIIFHDQGNTTPFQYIFVKQSLLPQILRRVVFVNISK